MNKIKNVTNKEEFLIGLAQRLKISDRDSLMKTWESMSSSEDALEKLIQFDELTLQEKVFIGINLGLGIENLHRKRGEILEITIDIEDNVDMAIYQYVQPQRDLDFWLFYHLFLKPLNFENKIKLLQDILKYEKINEKINCKELIKCIKDIQKINNQVKHSETLISGESHVLSRRTKIESSSDTFMPLELSSKTIEITDDLIDGVKQKSAFIKNHIDKLIEKLDKDIGQVK